MSAIPERMVAAVLTGHGGLDRIELRDDVRTPSPGPGWLLVAVAAAGVNNTDVNTRTGWYNQAITSGTTAEGGAGGFGVEEGGMGDWTGGLAFPRIQGADIVGRVVAVGAGVDPGRIGDRVVCAPYVIDPDDPTGLDSAGFLGAEYDGGFAQFAAVPARNAIAIADDLAVGDVDLATLPCSGGTAMNMALMAGARAGDLAFVTGASGGVGSFLVQILKALGGEVVAHVSASKAQAVGALGADRTVDRAAPDLVAAAMAASGGRAYSLIADVVGGPRFPDYLKLLRRGGRYVTAGAIAGPMVELDLRTLYLKNLEFYGSTVYRPETFAKLMALVAGGQVRPVAHKSYPLEKIHEAQTAFLEKAHVGSLVLIPPRVGGAGP